MKITIWCEGYNATGNFTKAFVLGTFEADCFDAAVKMLEDQWEIDRLNNKQYAQSKIKTIVLKDGTKQYYCWGCRLFDNEAEAGKTD